MGRIDNTYLSRIPKEYLEIAHQLGQKFLSDEEFNKELELCVEMEKKRFKEQERECLIPILHVLSLGKKDGKRTKIMMMLAIDDFQETKRDVLFMAGEKLRKEMPEFHLGMVFMASEAWTKGNMTEQEQEQFESGEIKQIADFADKQEVLMHAGLTLDLRTNMAMTKMWRASNNVVLLGDTHFMPWKDKGDETDPDLLMEFLRGYSSLPLEK